MSKDQPGKFIKPGLDTLVDHLRGIYASAVSPYPVSPLQMRAADEIERLRRELADLKALVAGTEWQSLPVEPTYQMAEAMGVKWEQGDGFPARYKAMLAIAPKPHGDEGL